MIRLQLMCCAISTFVCFTFRGESGNQGSGTVRASVRLAEVFKPIFELPKYKIRLQFKYMESVAESRGVGVTEYYLSYVVIQC
jgi:hypothetical protein